MIYLAHLVNETWVIVSFLLIITIMMAVDLGIVNRKSHVVSNREALVWTVIWISLAMGFSTLLFFVSPKEDAQEVFLQFQTAYWIEKALSVDNLFVFILVFRYFKVPPQYHHKVLFWGIIGALVMRAGFIFSGTAIIELTYLPEFNWNGQSMRINIVLTLFGFFLLAAGVRSFMPESDEDENKDFSKNLGARLVHRFFKVSNSYHDGQFFVVDQGIRMVTPLFVVVAVIEFSDLLFAVDSIPAIFAVSDIPVVLYTSNIFAILGLRSLYFLLANFIDRFHFLKHGLAFILTFIGCKMVISPFYHISSFASLSIVLGVLIFSTLISLLIPTDKNG